MGIRILCLLVCVCFLRLLHEWRFLGSLNLVGVKKWKVTKWNDKKKRSLLNGYLSSWTGDCRWGFSYSMIHSVQGETCCVCVTGFALLGQFFETAFFLLWEVTTGWRLANKSSRAFLVEVITERICILASTFCFCFWQQQALVSAFGGEKDLKLLLKWSSLMSYKFQK